MQKTESQEIKRNGKDRWCDGVADVAV